LWGGGFTVAEMLVVLGIMTLILAMAMPAYNLLSGNRSIESAQNQIGGVLNTARLEAIASQRITGIMFFQGAGSERVLIARVYATPPQPSDATYNTVDVFLDVFPDQDYVSLPPGVGCQVLDNASISGNQRTSDGYIGLNSYPAVFGVSPAPVGGVILFDGRGQLISLRYGLRTRYAWGSSNYTWTGMGKLLYPGEDYSVNNPHSDLGNPVLSSQFGAVLYNLEQFKNAGGTAGDPQWTNATYGSEERAEEIWLDRNSVPLLVNRYNGTLIKGE
jgi:type II secretory pathway pseudopilin PulG